MAQTKTAGARGPDATQPGRICVVGVDASRGPQVAHDRLAGADLIAGSARQLAAHAPKASAKVEISGDLDALGQRIESCAGRVVVLASGDPGFFGIVRALSRRFGRASLEVIPAASSVAQAFARISEPWDDAVVASAHGRNPRAAVNAARAHPKVAVLTSPEFGPRELAAELAHTGRELWICERLGDDDERITHATPHQMPTRSFSQPNVVLCLDPQRKLAQKQALAGARGPTVWALPEERFLHRDSQITKQEVRALAVSQLGPGLGDLVWDIGAGSGSIAIECARFNAAAIAVDCDPEACERIAENARTHGVAVQVVCAPAAQALDGLPDPDCVFLGGGGNELAQLVHQSTKRRPRSIVATLAGIERVGECASALERGGYAVDARMLSAARVRGVAGVSRLAATNPVFVVCGMRG